MDLILGAQRSGTDGQTQCSEPGAENYGKASRGTSRDWRQTLLRAYDFRNGGRVVIRDWMDGSFRSSWRMSMGGFPTWRCVHRGMEMERKTPEVGDGMAALVREVRML